jgi:hypothetical protein
MDAMWCKERLRCIRERVSDVHYLSCDFLQHYLILMCVFLSLYPNIIQFPSSPIAIGDGTHCCLPR